MKDARRETYILDWLLAIKAAEGEIAEDEERIKAKRKSCDGLRLRVALALAPKDEQALKPGATYGAHHGEAFFVVNGGRIARVRYNLYLSKSDGDLSRTATMTMEFIDAHVVSKNEGLTP